MRLKNRILILGDFSPFDDEGMKKTANNIFCHLSKEFCLKKFDLSRKDLLGQINEAVAFRPEIIHLISGPTIRSFLLMKILKKMSRSKTLVSAIHPEMPEYLNLFCDIIRVDCMTVMSNSMGYRLREYSRRIESLPSGVDLRRFKIVSDIEKRTLREKFGFHTEDFIVFHAGPIVKSRNLEWLIDLRRHVDCVLVAGSNSTAIDRETIKLLCDSDIKVISNFVPEINELYQLSDCYVFPTIEAGGSIDFPLSILEAMACGIPVVTTKLGALSEKPIESKGINYVNDYEGFLTGVLFLKEGGKIVSKEEIRSSVGKFSWEEVAIKVGRLYKELVQLDA